MVIFYRNLFYAAVLLYICGWAALLLSGRKTGIALIRTGIALNLLSAILRYYYTWPMMPMYQGIPFLCFFFGFFAFVLPGKKETTISRPPNNFDIEARDSIAETLTAATTPAPAHPASTHRTSALRPLPPAALSLPAATLLMILGLTAALFPNDFYLPFPLSGSIFAHGFFLFGAVGKACLLVAASYAWAILRRYDSIDPGSGKKEVTPWIVAGFAFWTLSMFSGETWSYLGWGSPVVWDDPAITTTLATWFYYGAFLHLHLLKWWNQRRRLLFAAGGAGVIFIMNCWPEMGPWEAPILPW